MVERTAGEIAIQLYCAYFGVPTILVAGDHAACRGARVLEKVETVETKKGLSRYTAINVNPIAVRDSLRETARMALENKTRYSLKRIASPYQLKIQLMCPNHVNSLEMRGAKRLDPQTIVLESDDFMDLWSQQAGWAPGVHNALYGVSGAL